MKIGQTSKKIRYPNFKKFPSKIKILHFAKINMYWKKIAQNKLRQLATLFTAVKWREFILIRISIENFLHM